MSIELSMTPGLTGILSMAYQRQRGTGGERVVSGGWGLMGDEGVMRAVLLMSDGYGWVEMVSYCLAISYFFTPPRSAPAVGLCFAWLRNPYAPADYDE
jgi:hypothetical protein